MPSSRSIALGETATLAKGHCWERIQMWTLTWQYFGPLNALILKDDIWEVHHSIHYNLSCVPLRSTCFWYVSHISLSLGIQLSSDNFNDLLKIYTVCARTKFQMSILLNKHLFSSGKLNILWEQHCKSN